MNRLAKVVAFVPMKLNNERLKSKNTLPLAGAPLCSYILNTLKRVRGLDEIYVYCSSEGIKEYIPEGVKYLKRGTHLDLSSTSILEVCKAFMSDVNADVYVLTHATAPFLTTQIFEQGLQAVTEGEYDSAFSVKKIQAFMWREGKPLNFSLDNVPRTQDLTPIYEETCGIYMWKKETMDELGRRTGNNPYLINVSEIESIDIDTQENFNFAELVMKAL
jgi:CMP-N-acetylneuraminic acid synthetase